MALYKDTNLTLYEVKHCVSGTCKANTRQWIHKLKLTCACDHPNITSHIFRHPCHHSRRPRVVSQGLESSNIYGLIARCTLLRSRGHRGLILEVSKCENGQKMPKREAKPGKIVLFLKITSFFVCRKKIIFSKWMPWHTLMIALFSEKIMWVFPEELFVLNCCPHTSTII